MLGSRLASGLSGGAGRCALRNLGAEIRAGAREALRVGDVGRRGLERGALGVWLDTTGVRGAVIRRDAALHEDLEQAARDATRRRVTAGAAQDALERLAGGALCVRL